MTEASTARPRLAILILTRAGRHHVDRCIASVRDAVERATPGNAGANQAPDEIWLIDNASEDGTAAHVAAGYPAVKVFALPENIGFPRAYNEAAGACGAEWLVFLNDDTRVDREWLVELHRTRVARPAARFIASRMLSWDGSRTDFVGADTFFSGHAWQVDKGEPAPSDPPAERRLLFGCAGSLMVHRDTFQAVGGFDPDYFSFFEDVDLGWRASLLGHETWLSGAAVTYHKQHATWGERPSVAVRYLTERNALANVFKNFSPERMGLLLLASAALTFRRGMCSSDALHATGAPFLSSEAIAYLLALVGFDDLLPALQERRSLVQKLRTLADDDVRPLFGRSAAAPTFLGETYRRNFDSVVRGLSLDGGIFTATYSPVTTRAALDAVGQLSAVCRAVLSGRFDERSFLGRSWEFGWEHSIDDVAARALRTTDDLLTAWVGSPLDEAALGALAPRLGELATVVRQGAAARRSALPTAREPSQAVRLGAGGAPTVSVIVRTKDRPAELERALASVAVQSRRPDEVIVVNDGGASPADVVDRFRRDLAVVFVDLRENRGRSAAAQAGLVAARSEYVGFLDDDDVLLPNHVETLAAAAAREGAPVVYGDVECATKDVGPDGRSRIVKTTVLGGPMDRSRLGFENTVPLIGLLVNREFAIGVGGFDPTVDYFEDWDLVFRMSRRARFVHCPVVTARYTIDPGRGQGLGLVGARRWPALARFFDAKKDAIDGGDWARFYQDQIDPLRRDLAAVRALAATREVELRETRALAEAVQRSRLWRLGLFLRRLVGRA